MASLALLVLLPSRLLRGLRGRRGRPEEVRGLGADVVAQLLVVVLGRELVRHFALVIRLIDVDCVPPQQLLHNRLVPVPRRKVQQLVPQLPPPPQHVGRGAAQNLLYLGGLPLLDLLPQRVEVIVVHPPFPEGRST
eukprot:CAMPEP_0114151706 /NCGR_PEP_ID=MMETSP0043_2-20121206/23395_1 /TAXON_ID=464988 /ORGANISM="Hemiselmis andersenii, Strain CCMP644" /LENGTH=135 /DNA_ID=CAMNT_0001246553 /DNA_START=52 /DNA_END=456 /DNA_ORIENTATION=-